MKHVPIEGFAFILILFGYAFNETWPLIDKGVGHTFWNGLETGLTHRDFWKGFTDLVLQNLKASAICLVLMYRVPNVARFFYVLYWYSVLNIFLYWYNYCQWQWPFYIMWGCLLRMTIKLWPKSNGKLIKM